MLHAGQSDAQGKSKIEPFVNMLCDRFTAVYTPWPFVSIDEMIVGYKGRWAYKQFNKTKPKKYHIKSFGLCDSLNGYVLNVLTYYGQTTSYNPNLDPHSKEAIKIFDALCPCIGSGYHIYADRWYTTRDLVDWCLDNDQYYTGTYMSNRKGFPVELKNARLDHMSHVHYMSGDRRTMACGFKDKKAKNPVLLVSTR